MTTDPFYAAQLADTVAARRPRKGKRYVEPKPVGPVVAEALKADQDMFRRFRAACQWATADLDLDAYAARLTLTVCRLKANHSGGCRKDASRRGAAPAREDVT